MTTVVLDTSVTAAWFFEDETTALTEAVLDLLADGEAVVPALWRYEVANVLAVACRRERATEAQAARFLDVLNRLPIRVDPDPTDMPAVLALALRHQLSAYDAAYLMLAERTGAPLATLDKRLADACRTAGVVVVS